jgi:hypothetical protein
VILRILGKYRRSGRREREIRYLVSAFQRRENIQAPSKIIKFYIPSHCCITLRLGAHLNRHARCNGSVEEEGRLVGTGKLNRALIGPGSTLLARAVKHVQVVTAHLLSPSRLQLNLDAASSASFTPVVICDSSQFTRIPRRASYKQPSRAPAHCGPLIPPLPLGTTPRTASPHAHNYIFSQLPTPSICHDRTTIRIQHEQWRTTLP